MIITSENLRNFSFAYGAFDDKRSYGEFMLNDALALGNTAYQMYRDWRTRRREDSAYQRASEDMRKAGLNPLLHNVSPASSSAGPQDIGVSTALQRDLYKSQASLQNAQALSSVVSSAKELATFAGEAGLKLGAFSFGGKLNVKDNTALMNYMNTFLSAAGLEKLQLVDPNSAKEVDDTPDESTFDHKKTFYKKQKERKQNS